MCRGLGEGWGGEGEDPDRGWSEVSGVGTPTGVTGGQWGGKGEMGGRGGAYKPASTAGSVSSGTSTAKTLGLRRRRPPAKTLGLRHRRCQRGRSCTE